MIKKEALWLYMVMCLFSLSIPSTANSGTQNSNPDNICDSTLSELAISSEWLSLLHYKKTGERYQSRIKSGEFFLSESGAHEPLSEIIAFKNQSRLATSPNQHPGCRFPARAYFLSTSLNDKSLATPDNCLWNDTNKQLANTTKVSLIFPAPQIRGPGTMFGHILLRFDNPHQPTLLSPSINYAARTTGSNTLSLVWKGLTGGFNGHFIIKPYYLKIKEYSDMESRDIWEYPLSLSPERIKMISLHAIELQDSYSQYYFLDENCASVMQDIMCIGVDKSSERRTSPWVIPSEVVHTAWQMRWTEKPIYQPSSVTKIDHIVRTAPSDAILRAKDLIGFNTTQQTAFNDVIENKAHLLASEMIKYKYTKFEIDQEAFTAQLSRHGNKDTIIPTEPTAPHAGHNAARLSLATLAGSNEKSSIEIGIRPAYHSLEDAKIDGSPLSELELLKVRARIRLSTGDLNIHEATLINIKALPSSNDFTNQWSWMLYIGGSRRYLGQGAMPLHFQAAGGLGKAKTFLDSGTAYVLWGIRASAGTGINGYLSAGPIMTTGIHKAFSAAWYSRIEGEFYMLPKAPRPVYSTLEISTGYRASKNQVILGYMQVQQPSGESSNNEAGLRWQTYF